MIFTGSRNDVWVRISRIILISVYVAPRTPISSTGRFRNNNQQITRSIGTSSWNLHSSTGSFSGTSSAMCVSKRNVKFDISNLVLDDDEAGNTVTQSHLSGPSSLGNYL